MADKIRHVDVNGTLYDVQSGNVRNFYAACSSGATAQTKVVSIPEVSALETGDHYTILMANAQTYNGIPKLQINSLTEKQIVRNGSSTASRYEWQAGEVVEFIYDGTNMVLLDGAVADTTYYGVTKLSSATDSNAEDVAATPKAVKAAYDLANSAPKTAFTGATANTNGAIGLVPAPTAGQQNMFLKGDGTWGETGGGDVQAVNEVSPDSNGNVALTAADIPTSAVSGETEVDGALSSLNDKIDNLQIVEYDPTDQSLVFRSSDVAAYDATDNSIIINI